MPERVVLYMAADGTHYPTPEEAHRHDVEQALINMADEYVEGQTGHRTVSKTKAKTLLVEFTMQVLFNGGNLIENLQNSNSDDDLPPA